MSYTWPGIYWCCLRPLEKNMILSEEAAWEVFPDAWPAAAAEAAWLLAGGTAGNETWDNFIALWTTGRVTISIEGVDVDVFTWDGFYLAAIHAFLLTSPDCTAEPCKPLFFDWPG